MIDLSGIPHEPGCYLFKDSEASVIYIGKAARIFNPRGRFACRWWGASLVGGRLGLRPNCSGLLCSGVKL